MDKLKILNKFFKDRGLAISGNSSPYAIGDRFTLGGNWYIAVKTFPDNCGMKILTGLQGTDSKVSQLNQVALLEYVKYQLGRTKDRPGLLVYTINKSQSKLEKIFERTEFEPMWEGINPHHGAKHVIKMFGFKLYNYKKDEVDALPSLR